MRIRCAHRFELTAENSARFAQLRSAHEHTPRVEKVLILYRVRKQTFL